MLMRVALEYLLQVAVITIAANDGSSKIVTVKRSYNEAVILVL